MSQWTFQAPPELSDEQYARWQTLLEERTGICFLQHKSILQKGLSQRMREVGVDDYEDYYRRVSAIPEGVVEWTLLVDRISVKETSFFREPKSYSAVRSFLAERIASSAQRQDYTIDLWSVGCSTGEEALSLAMVANELIEKSKAKIFLGVMATDISKTALLEARRGVYSKRKVDSVPDRLKGKYFTQTGANEFTVLPELLQKVCFTQGNIIEFDRAPKMAIDVIFFQNVLVYFRRWRHKEVLDALVEHLKPGGILVVGPGEVSSWQHPLMRRSADDTIQAYVRHA
jgi:chemotaxis protein methyltransferase CheR/type IV pilus assembly protein PilK